MHGLAPGEARVPDRQSNRSALTALDGGGRVRSRTARREDVSREALDLLARLARHLDVDELAVAIVAELRRCLRGATALVSLQPGSQVPAAIADDRDIRLVVTDKPCPPLLIVPIVDRDEAQGWVAFARDENLAGRDEAAIGHLLRVAQAAAIPARNARRHRAALELVMTDALTSLLNRRGLETALEREEENARRSGQRIACLVADLDGLKEINDRHGHAAGDHALRAFARVMRSVVRRTDHVARMGGDEFVVILPGADENIAVRLQERLEAALARVRLDGASGPPIPLRASFGTADIVEARGSTAEMLELADRRLYAAKSRTRVRARGDEIAVPAAEVWP